jgi:hypothetical protein
LTLVEEEEKIETTAVMVQTKELVRTIRFLNREQTWELLGLSMASYFIVQMITRIPRTAEPTSRFIDQMIHG